MFAGPRKLTTQVPTPENAWCPKGAALGDQNRVGDPSGAPKPGRAQKPLPVELVDGTQEPFCTLASSLHGIKKLRFKKPSGARDPRGHW